MQTHTYRYLSLLVSCWLKLFSVLCISATHSILTGIGRSYKVLSLTNLVYTLYVSILTSLDTLLKSSILPPLHHLHLSQPAIKVWQSGSFALSYLSLNHSFIIPSIPPLLRSEATLREHAQHLSPSCCQGVQSLRLPAWASLCSVLYKQAAAAVPPGHIHSVAITETVRPLKISGAHQSSHTK